MDTGRGRVDRVKAQKGKRGNPGLRKWGSAAARAGGTVGEGLPLLETGPLQLLLLT